MRLDWIDDILAVLDTGSLAHAAEKRMLTQSAFTRRVRKIEDSIGATLFDRRRKPVRLMAGVQALEPELREASARLHQLNRSLQTISDPVGKPLSFMCQHALTATMSTQVVRAATRAHQASVRVQSGNQDECLVRLLSREVDLAVMYALPDEPAADVIRAFDAVHLGEDRLIPVCAPALREVAFAATVPMIAYPGTVFLGQVYARQIAPYLPNEVRLMTVAETTLTLTMLQLTLNEIGIAWLPLSLIAEALGEGRLVRLDGAQGLPTQLLTVQMLRLHDAPSVPRDAVWQVLAQELQLAAL